MKVKEFAQVINGATPSTSNPENYGGDIAWITPKDLSDQKNKYISSGERSITKKGYNSCSTTLLPSGNILLSSRAPIGLLAITANECCTNQGFKNLLIDKKKVDVEYLYYYLKHHIKEIEALGVGTTFKEVSKTAIENFDIEIPALEKQKQISNILASIDEKIVLNRSMNQTLEAMAKQLYDYWFVQFDFPDKNGKPYKSSGGKMVWNEKLKREIPEGWSVVSIFDELDVLYGYPFSTELFSDNRTDIPVVRIRDIQNGTTSVFSTEEVDNKYRLRDGDLIIGMDGNFHMNIWTNNNAYLNQRCVRLREIDGVTTQQTFYAIQPYIKAKEQRSIGSTVGHLLDSDLKELHVIKADNESQSVFNELIKPVVKMKIECAKEIFTLQSLRDTLLPLLMNGQVTIKN